jgi:glycosyltransferase involved in cell wall biosynthesis
VPRLRVLHAIHDFLPRHRAGSEIYAFDLASALAARHDVWVLAAEYDPSANHGALRWRTEGTLPVIEVVNNWEFESFDESYASARLNDRITHVLDAVRPDIVHVHNLLNLSLDLPRLARARGIPAVATLHDYTMVCISGGQRLHRAEQHVCTTIDADRCARCFGESPFGPQLAAGRLASRTRASGVLRMAAVVRRHVPALASAVGSHAARGSIDPSDVRRRLAYVRHVFDTIDLFVAPSAALADEYVRLGVPADRMWTSENGCGARASRGERTHTPHLAIGYVGSLVWHKGIHVLLESARALRGAFRITIHGDTAVSPEYTRELERLASGLPVTFAGPFDRADVHRIYAPMDVLVVPSLWPENAPIVVQEAFLHAVPVVAAAVGGIPETVRDGENGRLFDPRAPDALTAILQTLIDDPSERVRLASGATPVKSIADDASDWEARYRQVLEAAHGCAGRALV